MMRAFYALPLLIVAACAPSTPQLVEQRHYREALCAAHARPADEPLVADAIMRDLDMRVHVSLLDVEELHLRAVRVRLAMNAIPVDHLWVRASGIYNTLVPGMLRDLLDITNEKFPVGESRGFLDQLLNGRQHSY